MHRPLLFTVRHDPSVDFRELFERCLLDDVVLEPASATGPVLDTIPTPTKTLHATRTNRKQLAP